MIQSFDHRPGAWQTARIEHIVSRTPRLRSYFLRLSRPLRHLAGQHVDVRLTAADGYIAERSYSIASEPDGNGLIELAIERLDDGEVSPWFHDVAEAGDEVELRGPIGWSFAWTPTEEGPVLLLGGGSGIVPLLAMARAHRRHPRVPMALLYSARTGEDAPFVDELIERRAAQAQLLVRLAFTRETANHRGDYGRRVDPAMLGELLDAWGHAPAITFICGANAFVNAASSAAIAAGVPVATIRTERFGG